jgi:hypothetical protein
LRLPRTIPSPYPSPCQGEGITTGARAGEGREWGKRAKANAALGGVVVGAMEAVHPQALGCPQEIGLVIDPLLLEETIRRVLFIPVAQPFVLTLQGGDSVEHVEDYGDTGQVSAHVAAQAYDRP